jgi:hypothetical protein
LGTEIEEEPECLRIFQRAGYAAEAELVSAIRTLESLEKLATEDLLQYTERKEKAIPRPYPTTVVG